MDPLEKAYRRVVAWADRDKATGCLVSRYSVGSHGYAQAWDGSNVTLAHLVVWRYVNGPIKKGWTVDHEKCRNRRCIEITHLRLLPNLENARRNQVGDWPLGTCRNGHGPEHWHPKSPTNQKGYCNECRNVIQRRRRAAGKRS